MHKGNRFQLHFVGIGGIGMSGIAEVFHNQGYRVSGSDLSETETTARLKKLGVKVFSGHASENILGANVVVISSAVRGDNPEVLAANDARIPVIPRAEMLGELMRKKIGIAVAGTHGKTTTTSMMAEILIQGKFDPTVVIGGKVNSLGGNAKLGLSDWVLVEADESDGSFLHLPATYGIITNIDNDHVDHYGTQEAIDRAFVNFVGKLPFYGVAAVCVDDVGVQRNHAFWSKPVVTYGFSSEADFVASAVRSSKEGSFFKVEKRNREGVLKPFGEISLSVPGKHNVLNALGCIALSDRLEIDVQAIVKGLSNFRGVGRRFEVRWTSKDGKRAIIDDYAHHPTELRATLQAARMFWPGRIISVFQPHRFSRTENCWADFADALGESDVLLISDIYPAGEKSIPGIDSEKLSREIEKSLGSKKNVLYSGNLERTAQLSFENLQDGDLVLCMGAGSVTKIPSMIIELM